MGLQLELVIRLSRRSWVSSFQNGVSRGPSEPARVVGSTTKERFYPADEGRAGGRGVSGGRGGRRSRGRGCDRGRPLAPEGPVALGGARVPRRGQRQRRKDLRLLHLDDHDPPHDLHADGALHLPLYPR